MGAARNAKQNKYRAPRYTLRPHDSKGMRFSRKRRGAQIFDTEIVNLSETGMAFRVAAENAPGIGETIKVEFNVPGDDHKIAWFANVIWLETPFNKAYRRKELVKAGIQFHDMPDRHQEILALGLSYKFREVANEVRRQKILSVVGSLPEVAMYLGIFALAAAFFYYFSQRTPNYDADRPTQWGQRFFQKVITEKDK